MRSALLLSVVLLACSERFIAVDGDANANADDAGADAESSSPVVDAAPDHGEHREGGGACETVGRTGVADTCTLFAYCGHRRFEVDCSARFTCVCSEPDVDGGVTKQIVAQPTFCESEASQLGAAFEVARRACGW